MASCNRLWLALFTASNLIDEDLIQLVGVARVDLWGQRPNS